MYGIDWEGPSPIAYDDNTVQVDDLPQLLSDDNVAELRSLLPAFTSLSDEWMSYTIARMYVLEHCC